MDKPAVRDGSLLLFRFVLGIIFVAHGFDKFFRARIDRYGSAVCGVGGAAGPIVGVFGGNRGICGGIIFDGGFVDHDCCGNIGVVDGGGVLFGAHECRVFIAGGGYEYVLLLIVSLVLIVVFGSGRASIDEVLSRQG